jgi:apolipoprotein N-acyltransferase
LVLPFFLVVAGAAVSVFAFPPFGPGILIVPGVALLLAGIRRAGSARQGLLLGVVFGLAFYGGLMWWLSELGLIAVIPLVMVNAVFPALLGWWLARHNTLAAGPWVALAVGGWAALELFRYNIPLNGFEWGALGYALSDQPWARGLSSLVGTSGLTVLVVLLAGSVLVLRKRLSSLAAIVGVAVVVLIGFQLVSSGDPSAPISVAIVQGSTPCPFEHCAPNERLRTYEQHLKLTKTITPGSVDLVVWSEGSTGSINADPVQNPEVGAAIGVEAERIGAWVIVGSDRPTSDTHWVNANVVFDSSGRIVGEYRKQHPVPFGEYIPLRPLFEWIPALDQVPRDQIPGDEPVVWDTDFGVRLGSVISFEGAFARYPRQHVNEGATVIVVASNEGSYGLTPASDQFIGMTRMRAAELGTPVIHAAVTGKSTFIDRNGAFNSTTGLGTEEILFGTFVPGEPTLYSRIADTFMYLAAIVGIAMWWRSRPLVGSSGQVSKED